MFINKKEHFLINVRVNDARKLHSIQSAFFVINFLVKIRPFLKIVIHFIFIIILLNIKNSSFYWNDTSKRLPYIFLYLYVENFFLNF